MKYIHKPIPEVRIMIEEFGPPNFPHSFYAKIIVGDSCLEERMPFHPTSAMATLLLFLNLIQVRICQGFVHDTYSAKKKTKVKKSTPIPQSK